MPTYENSFLYRYDAIILFFTAEFIYENSFLICVVLHFRLVYNNLKSIFNKNSHKENVYHYNSHSH